MEVGVVEWLLLLKSSGRVSDCKNIPVRAVASGMKDGRRADTEIG